MLFLRQILYLLFIIDGAQILSNAYPGYAILIMLIQSTPSSSAISDKYSLPIADVLASVSMVTPVWNGAKTISQTLASVRAQGAACHEYIVLDSMSDDGTREIIEANRDLVTVYVREKDTGLFDAMNRGIARARSAVVGIINADDLLTEGALNRVQMAFQDPAVAYVYSDVRIVDSAGHDIGMFRARRDWVAGKTAWHGRDWRFVSAISHPGLFVRRRVYDEIGVFDLRYRLAADHDFISRLISRNCVGAFVEEPLACFRIGGLSGGDLRLFAEDEAIARRFGVPATLARLNRYRSSLGRIKQRAFGQVLGRVHR